MITDHGFFDPRFEYPAPKFSASRVAVYQVCAVLLVLLVAYIGVKALAPRPDPAMAPTVAYCHMNGGYFAPCQNYEKAVDL